MAAVSEEPTSSAPSESTVRAGRKALRIVIAGLVAVSVFGIFWVRSAHRARDYAGRAKQATAALRACFSDARLTAPTPREALLYGPADEKPLAKCRDSYDEARRNALALRDVRLKRDREGAALMASELEKLLGFPFGETARGFVEQNIDIEAAFETIESAATLACRASALENDDYSQSCLPPPTPAPPARVVPTPRVVLDIPTHEHPISTAWRATAQKNSISVAASLREPDASSFAAYVAVSDDEGERFTIESLTGPPTRPAPVEAPSLIVDGAARLPRFVLAIQRADDGETHGIVAQ
jgi:hypothetical protein